MRGARPVHRGELTWHGLALLAATLAAALLYGGEPAHLSSTRIAAFVAVEFPAALIWLDATRRSSRTSLGYVIAIGLVMRLVALLTPIFLSGDIFRYVWDGRVQLAGINPYTYLPADPALSFLRDATIFPNINRATVAHTIYPPAAELVFAALAALSPTPLCFRLGMVAAEAVAVAALLRLLRQTGRNPSQILIYFWQPQFAWEFAGNGHCDALVVMFIALALLAVGKRPALAGSALACATLVKFIPAVILPALWRRGDRRLAVAFVVTIAALYAVYARAGTGLLGFLPGYVGEEAGDGTGLWVLAGLSHILPITRPVELTYLALAALVLAALAWRFWRPTLPQPTEVARNAAWLGFAAMLALSPHYAWYYSWLAVPATIAPESPVLLLIACSVLLYPDPWGEGFYWKSLVFAPPLLLALHGLKGHTYTHAFPARQERPK